MDRRIVIVIMAIIIVVLGAGVIRTMRRNYEQYGSVVQVVHITNADLARWKAAKIKGCIVLTSNGNCIK